MITKYGKIVIQNIIPYVTVEGFTYEPGGDLHNPELCGLENLKIEAIAWAKKKLDSLLNKGTEQSQHT